MTSIRSIVRPISAAMIVLFSMLGSGLMGIGWDAGQRAGAVVDDDLFVDEFVATVSERTLSGAWLPDGRLLTPTKDGAIKIVDPSDGSSDSIFTMPNVATTAERGALDIVLHPDFQINNQFFVYWVRSGEPGRMRVSRLTLSDDSSDVGDSQVLIWDNPGPGHVEAFHAGGSLNISADNKLLLTIGDGFDPAQSQDLANVFGKVIRLNLDGSIPGDNPFIDGAGANLDEIYAYGLRNPFRAWVDQATGVFWVGDVGGNTDTIAYEEVNQIVAGGDYGWPRCEGPLDEPKDGPTCPAGVEAPWHYYGHDAGGGFHENRSITGGEVLRSSEFPAEMFGSYVYADWAQDGMYWVEINADGSAGIEHEIPLVSGAKPVWVSAGPDGHIYYLQSGFGDPFRLRRVRYTGQVDRVPVITSATATPSSGPAPLTVSFDSVVDDPDGDVISYIWNFGDGNSATGASPTHVYTSSGSYNAQLVVTANGVSAASPFVSIMVGGGVPTVTITEPDDGATFDAGDAFDLTAAGNDPDGSLSANSYAWTVRLIHNAHQHPRLTEVTGNPYPFPISTVGHDYRGSTGYEITVKVTDSDGLTATDTVSIFPNKVDLTLTNSLGTGTLLLDGITSLVPFTLDTAIGFEHVIETPRVVCAPDEWSFVSWDDDGDRQHSITVPATDSTVSATYGPLSQPCGTSDLEPPVVSFTTPWTDSVEAAGSYSDTGGSGMDAVRYIAVDLGAAGASGVPQTEVRFWNGSTWGANLVTHEANLTNGQWSVAWDPDGEGGTGLYVLGLTASDNDGNVWPGDKQYQAVLVYSDFTKPVISVAPTTISPLGQIGGRHIEWSGSASEDDFVIRKVRWIVRHAETNTYWNGSRWISGAEAASDTGILRHADLSGPLLQNPQWSHSLAITEPGTYQTIHWAQNGAYSYSTGVSGSFVVEASDLAG